MNSNLPTENLLECVCGWEHLKFVRTDELADRGENQRK
jgi:hypothetical protein